MVVRVKFICRVQDANIIDQLVELARLRRANCFQIPISHQTINEREEPTAIYRETNQVWVDVQEFKKDPWFSKEKLKYHNM